MKSHIRHPKDRVYVTETQIHDAVEAEIETIRKECHQEAVQAVTTQTLATVLYCLETCYGWKEQRLKKFLEYLHDTEELMVNPSPLHHRFNHLDNMKRMKERYNIDLNKEFPAHCVDERGQRI